MGEFELIQRYFQGPSQEGTIAPGVRLGIGDDCALLLPQAGMELALSSDMLVEGRHFLSTAEPSGLGHKTLAVNLSDLAAMGAEPLCFTLALALPQVDAPWLERFSQGLLALARDSQCPLVGGDTTRGPLNLCVTVLGQVPPHQSLRRQNAQAGDDLYVSGTLGDARLALEALRGTVELDGPALRRCRARLERPTPRLALGRALRGVAHAAADLSDGLLSDLGHILKASGVGATLDLDQLLACEALTPDLRQQPSPQQLTCLLSGGDDYELVFTAPAHRRGAVQQAAQQAGTPVHRIGHIHPGSGCMLISGGQPLPHDTVCSYTGFDHFASST
jgi:thiamine-monophosphate kinase